jgi:hypothetical protein
MIMVYSDDYPDFPPITGLVVTTADEPFKPGDTVIYYSKEGHFTEPQVPGEEIEIGRVVSIEGDTVVIQYLGKQSEGDADLAPETCDRRFWQISRVIEILHARRPPRRNPKPG